MTTKIQSEMGSGPFKGRGRLEDIVKELRRQIDARSDFVIDTRELQLAPGTDRSGKLVALLKPSSDSARDFVPRDGYPVLDQAFVQMGGAALPDGIPTKFLRRALETAPQRTCDFVTGLMHDLPNRRMVRVLDGNVRAYLSKSYRAIDNYDIAAHVLGLMQEHDALPIEASLTDSAMRLRFVTRNVVEQLQEARDGSRSNWFAGGLGAKDALRRVAAQTWGDLPGDAMLPALGFKNSETGHGGCDLDGGILLGVCFNLAWVTQLVHQIHIGEQLDEQLYTRETIQKSAELVHLKLRDASAKYFTKEGFADVCAKVKGTQDAEVKAPSVALEVAIKAKDSPLNDSDMDKLLLHFAHHGFTEFGLGQAITRHAQDVEPGRAEELEWFGGEVCMGKLGKGIAHATKMAELAGASA